MYIKLYTVSVRQLLNCTLDIVDESFVLVGSPVLLIALITGPMTHILSSF